MHHYANHTAMRLGTLAMLCTLLWCAKPSTAIAIPNTGRGYDGELVVSSITYVDSVKSAVTGNVSAGDSFIPLGSTAGFQSGHEILVFTAQGVGAAVGSYNFYTIQNVSPSGVTIFGQVPDAFNVASDRTFVQQVPNYTDVTIQAGGVLTASAWDGSTGGVVAFRARGEVDVQLGGAILADGLGFRGGAGIPIATSGTAPGIQGESYNGLGAISTAVDPTTGLGQRNFGAGGGGLGEVSGGDVGGGGGGGSYGDSPLGTNGLDSFAPTPYFAGGQAGAAYGTNDLSQIFFGSGGGSGAVDRDAGPPVTSGAGGIGGGVIFIAASEFNLDGTLRSAGLNGGAVIGESGDEAGGGGGGAGGSIYLALLDPTPFQSLDPLLITPGGLGGADSGTGYVQNGGLGGVGRFFATLAETFYAPEPSSAVVWGMGGLFLMLRRRRQRSNV